MANLRIISDNAVKRASTITASSTAGSLIADRLRLGVKSKVWRATAKSAVTLSVVLAAPETLDCVALAFTNMTSAGTIRIQGYATSGAASPVIDVTKTVMAPPNLGLPAAGVNSFGNGSASQAVCWFTATSLQRVDIILNDATNASAYIEASCLVMGASWSPRLTMTYGAGAIVKDSTKNERTESGNLRSDRGTIARSISFDLKNLSSAERTKLWGMMLANGLFSPMFVSMYPTSADAAEEQMHQLYGKLTQQAKLSVQSFGLSQATLEYEEI